MWLLAKWQKNKNKKIKILTYEINENHIYIPLLSHWGTVCTKYLSYSLRINHKRITSRPMPRINIWSKEVAYHTETNFILHGLTPARVWRENSSSHNQENLSSANAKWLQFVSEKDQERRRGFEGFFLLRNSAGGLNFRKSSLTLSRRFQTRCQNPRFTGLLMLIPS